MIGQVNPGRLLPFYKTSDWLRHKLVGQSAIPLGVVCPHRRVLPFQIPVPHATTEKGWKLVSMTDGSELVMSGSLLELSKADDGSGAWISYKATNSIVTTECGFWQVVVTVGDGTVEQEYVSEVLHLKEMPATETNHERQWWVLEFSNESDLKNGLYQTGYVERLWSDLQPIFSNPQIVENRNDETDGFGRTVAFTTRVSEKVIFEVAGLPDFALSFLVYGCGLSNIYLKNEHSGTSERIFPSFGSRRDGIGGNIGVFECETWSDVITGCEENIILE